MSRFPWERSRNVVNAFKPVRGRYCWIFLLVFPDTSTPCEIPSCLTFLLQLAETGDKNASRWQPTHPLLVLTRKWPLSSLLHWCFCVPPPVRSERKMEHGSRRTGHGYFPLFAISVPFALTCSLVSKGSVFLSAQVNVFQ